MPVTSEHLLIPSLVFRPHPPLKTLHPSLDTALKGGLPSSSLVEIFGPKFTGKTSLLISLAISAALENRNAYIFDCCGAISSIRISEILSARSLSLSLLSRIHVCRVVSWDVLLSCIPHLLPSCRLIAIDGAAFLFRAQGKVSSLSRLEVLATRLLEHVTTLGGIVVFTNNIRIAPSGLEYTAMGDSWRHVCGTRLSLESRAGERRITVVRSLLTAPVSLEFCICAQGFSDPEIE